MKCVTLKLPLLLPLLLWASTQHPLWMNSSAPHQLHPICQGQHQKGTMSSNCSSIGLTLTNWQLSFCGSFYDEKGSTSCTSHQSHHSLSLSLSLSLALSLSLSLSLKYTSSLQAWMLHGECPFPIRGWVCGWQLTMVVFETRMWVEFSAASNTASDPSDLFFRSNCVSVKQQNKRRREGEGEREVSCRSSFFLLHGKICIQGQCDWGWNLKVSRDPNTAHSLLNWRGGRKKKFQLCTSACHLELYATLGPIGLWTLSLPLSLSLLAVPFAVNWVSLSLYTPACSVCHIIRGRKRERERERQAWCTVAECTCSLNSTSNDISVHWIWCMHAYGEFTRWYKCAKSRRGERRGGKDVYDTFSLPEIQEPVKSSGL